MLPNFQLVEILVDQIHNDLNGSDRRYQQSAACRSSQRSNRRPFRRLLAVIGNQLVVIGSRLQEEAEESRCSRQLASS